MLIGFRDLAGQANVAVSARIFAFFVDEHRQVFISVQRKTEQL